MYLSSRLFSSPLAHSTMTQEGKAMKVQMLTTSVSLRLCSRNQSYTSLLKNSVQIIHDLISHFKNYNLGIFKGMTHMKVSGVMEICVKEK